MKELWFEGSSDDTFGMTRNGDDTTSCDDYDNCGSGKPIDWRIWSPSETNGLVVTGQYGSGFSGGWLVGVSPADLGADDERDIPAWPMTIVRGERPYSPRLVIVVPDDVEIDCMQRIEGEG